MAKSNGALMYEALMSPWQAVRLPGEDWFKVHCEGSPSASQEGVNG